MEIIFIFSFQINIDSIRKQSICLGIITGLQNLFSVSYLHLNFQVKIKFKKSFCLDIFLHPVD